MLSTYTNKTKFGITVEVEENKDEISIKLGENDPLLVPAGEFETLLAMIKKVEKDMSEYRTSFDFEQNPYTALPEEEPVEEPTEEPVEEI